MEIKKVFFSYSRTDSDFALRLALDLKKEGFDVWIDKEDIRAGSAWDLEIEKALQTCDCLLFIQSAQSVNSVNVLDEVYYVLESNKTVIPVIINDSKTPFRIARLQHIEFIADYNSGLSNLVTNLKSGSFSELSHPGDTAIKKTNGNYPKKTPLFIASAILVIVVVITTILYLTGKNDNAPTKQTNRETIAALPLPETYVGEWTLASVTPEQGKKRGYLRIRKMDASNVKIITNFQFYYLKSNDTAFLSVFNGYAECASCAWQNEMQLTEKQIDIGTQEYKILKEDKTGEGKAGDTVRNAGGNHTIKASVTLQLAGKDSVIVKVLQPGSLALTREITVKPFEYLFLFKKEL